MEEPISNEERSLHSFSVDLVPLLREQCKDFELIPLANSAVIDGKVVLGFGRKGKMLDCIFQEESRMPTLDLAKAGIETDSRPPSALIEAAREFLKGRRFSIAPAETLDFNFLWTAYISDKWDGWLFALEVDVTAALAQNVFSNPGQKGLDRVTKKGDELQKKLTTVFEVALVGDLVPGLDLSGKVAVFRIQLINLLAPKGTQLRCTLDACMSYMEFNAEYEHVEEKLESAKKHWWFWPTEFLIHRSRDFKELQKERAKRIDKTYKTFLALFPHIAAI